MFQKKLQPEWPLTCPYLKDSFTDFMLSRQAMNCSPATLEFYKYTAGVFLAWAEKQSITNPAGVKARHVRQYLAEMASGGKKDTTVHDHARAIRTLIHFWQKENYITGPIEFQLPKLEKKRLPVLSADDLQTVLKADNDRDKALPLLMVDSGLRQVETINLTWGDVDISSGLLRVRPGKGKKDRSAVSGLLTVTHMIAVDPTQ